MAPTLRRKRLDFQRTTHELKITGRLAQASTVAAGGIMAACWPITAPSLIVMGTIALVWAERKK